jgi:hypothetical protein
MRFISGLILGVLITVGAAYIHDAMTAPTMSGSDASGYRMVNWDAVSRGFNRLATSARDEFDKLTGRGSHASATNGA